MKPRLRRYVRRQRMVWAGLTAGAVVFYIGYGQATGLEYVRWLALGILFTVTADLYEERIMRLTQTLVRTRQAAREAQTLLTGEPVEYDETFLISGDEHHR